MHDNTILLSISDDDNIRIWNTADPQYATCINCLNNHARFITDLTYYDKTLYEKMLLSLSADKTIRVWEPTTIAYALCAQMLTATTDKKQLARIAKSLKNTPDILDQLSEDEEQIISSLIKKAMPKKGGSSKY